MEKINGLMLLVIAFTVGFAGCGQSNEHAVFRSEDIYFRVLPNPTE